MLAHNLYELPFTPWDVENSGPLVVDLLLLVAYWRRPASRAVPMAILGWAALNLVIGGVVSVLPLAVLPFVPEQSLSHYAAHVLYAAGQVPLILWPWPPSGIGPTRRFRAEEAGMSERVVQTRVGRLTVSVKGGGDRRPTALLWHSLFVDDRSWERVTPDLERARRLVIVTGPGHGTSGDSGQQYSMEDCAQAALEVLAALGVEARSTGSAMRGGATSGSCSRPRPGPGAHAGHCRHTGPPVPARGQAEHALLVVLYRRFGPTRYLTDAVVEALLSERTRTTDPGAVDLVRDGFVTADRAGLANAVVSISLKRRDLEPLLPAVQAPTLFITGSAHPDWSPEQMRAAAALLPRGSTRVVDGAAYLVPLEAPAAFSRCVHEHWAAHPA